MKKTKEKFSLAKLAKNLNSMHGQRSKLYTERDENENKIRSLNLKIQLVETWQALERDLKGLKNLGSTLSTCMMGAQTVKVKKSKRKKKAKGAK